MSQIVVSDLTFAYDGSYGNVFEGLSFQIDSDWKLGLIGRNGRGKTTLLKLLMGEYEYSGNIVSSVAFDYFPFDVPDPGRNTYDVVASVCPGCEEWRIVRELSLLDIEGESLLRPFATLSNGERTRALLAAMFLREGRLQLIDEPTNHLDMQARTLLAGYLKKKKGFILVSHDRYFLDEVVDHVLSINKADIEVQQGNYSTWRENRELKDSYELRENDRLNREIAHLGEAAGRAANWSNRLEKTKYHSDNSGIRTDRGFVGAKSAKMMKRAKVTEARREKAVREKESLLKNIERTDRLSMYPLPYHQNRLINVSDLSIAYDGRTVLDGVRFSLERGGRIAVRGRNGSGKSSLLKLLAGADIQHGGQLFIGSNIVCSVVPQDTSFLKGGLLDFARDSGIDPGIFRGILKRLDLPASSFEKDLSEYSGGQKKKVLLARSLCQRAHVYIWDEPLNYVDLLSRVQLEELILKDRPTMIFVEHDRAFVNAVATEIITLSRDA